MLTLKKKRFYDCANCCKIVYLVSELYIRNHSSIGFSIWYKHLMTPNPNVVILKNWRPVKGLCGSVYMYEAPSPPRFLFGWSSNFVCSESGQIQNVKLLQNLVSNIPHPLPATCTYCTLTQGRGEGRFEPERRLEGQQFRKRGRKYQHDWLYLQSINSDKPAAKSL